MLKRKKTVKFVSQIIPSIASKYFFFKAIITFLFYFIFFFIGDMLISLERAKFSI